MVERLRTRFARKVQNRFYYGWIIVGAVLISNLAAFSNNSTFGLYVTQLEAEFGWSRSQIALAPTCATIFGALIAPLMGYLVDRFGVRALMIGGSLVAATSFYFLGNSTSLWHLYLGYSLAWGVLFPGVGQMASNVAITRWFYRYRGRAMGIVMMGASGSGLLFINVQNFLITAYSWREAWMFQALFTLGLVIVPIFFLMVENPEQVGITVREGEGAAGRVSKDGVPDARDKEEVSWTLGEAIRTRAFWVALVGCMLGSLVISGYFAHTVPHLENLGFSRDLAAGAWSLFFVVGIGAKFIWGFITEKITVRWSMVLLFLGEGMGIYLLMSAREPRDLYTFGIVGGFCHGPFLQLLNQVWGDYFGRKSISRIYSTVQPGVVLFNSIGPILGGVLYDMMGNYRRFLQILIGLSWLAAALFFLEPKPVKKETGL